MRRSSATPTSCGTSAGTAWPRGYVAPAARRRRLLAADGHRPVGGRAQERRQARRPCRPIRLPARHRRLRSRASRRWAGSSPPKSTVRGMAREACDAMLDWADRTFDATQPVRRSSHSAMTPSMKLAERLGFERQPDGVYRDEPISICRRRARPELLPAAAAASTAAAARRTAAARAAARARRGRGRADRARQRRADAVGEARRIAPRAARSPNTRRSPAGPAAEAAARTPAKRSAQRFSTPSAIA